MTQLEHAFIDILGFYPVYFRPPYTSCSLDCQFDIGKMGYHVVDYDLDTLDWANDSVDDIEISKDGFAEAIMGSNPAYDSFLVLSHDVHQFTVYSLTGYMLQMAKERGYKLVTVGQCLADPAENWYRLPGETEPRRKKGSYNGELYSGIKDANSTANKTV
jgi:peptidoglycan/xylan/chitin deacetylase (PgdA/CDA1 family)